MVNIIARMPATWLLKHFNWITNLPGRRFLTWNEGFKSLVHLHGTLTKQVETILADRTRLTSTSHETIYHHLLASADNYHDQITTQGLVSEAITLIAAGSDTVAQACTSAVFYTLSSPHVLERLIDELHDAWPNKDSEVGLRTLEKLPYLVGTV
jgi:cytochrome P450